MAGKFTDMQAAGKVGEISLIRRNTDTNQKGKEDTYRIEVQSVSRFLVLIHP